MLVLNLLYVFSPIVSVGLEIAIVVLLALVLKAVRKPSTAHDGTVEAAAPAVQPSAPAVISTSTPSVASKDAEIAAAIAVALNMSKK